VLLLPPQVAVISAPLCKGSWLRVTKSEGLFFQGCVFMSEKSCAVIAAAGGGTRMGGVSKPNIKLLGKTLFEYVLNAFCQSVVDEIVVVCSPDNIDSLKDLAKSCPKPIKFVLGGKARAESVFNGISATDADIVAVHDCARPFITADIINLAINTAVEQGASCVCSPVIDTVKYKDPDTGIITTPNRDNMFAVQTPQCVRKEYYIQAKNQAGDSFCNFTDETSLLENAGFTVEYIKRLENNMKLTATEDVPVAEAIMKQREKRND